MAGTATISQPGPASLLIDQVSSRAIIDWDAFSIGTGGLVHFNNGQGATLNRVSGPTVSTIDGTLTATGSVFLLNRNGVVIGPGGVINTGGSFIASTLDLPNDAFMAGGDLTFSGQSTASVINLGKISSLGGDVALFAHTVVNEGEIRALGGTAGLAAGLEILLRDTALDDGKILVRVGGPNTSVTNTGAIHAAVAELRAHHGNVYALAGNTTGIIQATGVTNRNGRVFLTAPGGRVVVSSPVRARRIRQQGALDGGDVFINARFASIGNLIDVDGLNGGKVTIETGALSLADPILARGLNGNGGEVSITALGDILAPSTALIDVSGTQNGGTIDIIGGHDTIFSGRLLATGDNGLGGDIDLSGGAIRLLSPTINASGDLGGGTIRIGGELQGGKHLLIDEIPNALRLAVTDGTTIAADATGTDGDGGSIILWADEKATVLGRISATPGSLTGNGGFVEISALQQLSVLTSAITTGHGERRGTILLDPRTFIVDTIANINQSVFILGEGYGFPDRAQPLEGEDLFGVSVSLDGTRLAVGAAFDDGFANLTDGFTSTANRAGAVYLFSFAGTDFTGGTLAAIIGEGYTGGNNIDLAGTLERVDQFGTSVSLDGTRLAVGATGDDGFNNLTDGVTSTGNGTGAVYLFTFAGTDFTGGNLAVIIGEGYTGGDNIDLASGLEVDDVFGVSVTLDGTRLAVGATGDDGFNNLTNGVTATNNDTGAVYLFTFSGTDFTGGTLAAIIGEGYTGGNNIDLAGNLEADDFFGQSVSLDGTRLAAGAPFDDGFNNLADGVTSTLNQPGAVYLFTFTATDFTGGTLAAIIGEGYTSGDNFDFAGTLERNDLFGVSVSLDGTRLAVGALFDDGFNNLADGVTSPNNQTGAVYLFSFAGTDFTGGTLAAIIGEGYTGGDNIDLAGNLELTNQFGASVSLDGTRLAVGANLDDGFNNLTNGVTSTINDTGAVYLFTFTAADFTGGTLVAIVGAGYTGGNNIDLAGNLEQNDLFGSSVSLDGTRLAVGATFDDGFADLADGFTSTANQTGAVYLFTFAGTDFTGGTLAAIIGESYTGGNNIDLVGTLERGDQFGASVSLDGTRLAVGATGDDGFNNLTDGVTSTSNGTGAIYLFTFTATDFTGGTLAAILGEGYTGSNNIDLAGSLEAGDVFGASVSLDGTRLAVGTFFDDGFNNLTDGVTATNNGTGAVYLFTFTARDFTGGTLAAVIGENYTGGNNINLAGNLEQGDNFGQSVSLDGTRLAVGGLSDDGFNNLTDGVTSTGNGTGAVYLFTFTATAFTGGTLAAIIGEGYTGTNNIDLAGNLEVGDFFGTSVSLDGTRLAVGALLDDGFNNLADGVTSTSNGTGAVYLFTFDDADFTGGTLAGVIGEGYTGDTNIDLAGNLGVGDQFGISVSLDGTRLAVGALFDDGFANLTNGVTAANNDTGAAYLFSNVFGDPVSDAVYAVRVGETITITPNNILALLNAGNNVILQANEDGIVNAPILANNPSGDAGDLTLQAGRSLFINAGITTDNGNLTLIANDTLANGVVDADRGPGDATITFADAVSINAGTGMLHIDLRDGAGRTNRGAGDVVFTGNNTVTAASLTLHNAGPETDNAAIFGAGTVFNLSGAGLAVTVSADIFTNDAGAGLFNFTGSGRFQIFSADFANDTRGGLTGRNLYNTSFGDALPAFVTTTSDNWFIFERQPTLTVTGTNTAVTYDGTPQTLSGFTVAGLVNGDTEAQALTTDPALGAHTNAGIHTTGNLLGGASAIGYDIALVQGTLTIDQRAFTVAATADNKVYDGTTTAAVTFGDNRIAGDTLTINSASADFDSTNVGVNRTVTVLGIALTGADAGNYALANTTANDLADITQRPLTVTANSGQSKVIGDLDPAAFTFSITTGSLVAGEVFTGALSRVPGEVIGTFPILQNTLALSANYALTYIGSPFSIFPSDFGPGPTEAPNLSGAFSPEGANGEPLQIGNTPSEEFCKASGYSAAGCGLQSVNLE